MLRALDAGLQIVPPGVGSGPHFCQGCGDPLRVARAGRYHYFEHTGRSCLGFPITESYLALKGHFVTRWPSHDSPVIDTVIGDRLVSMAVEHQHVVVEALTQPESPQEIRRRTRAWNAMGWHPLWIWCQPFYGSVHRVEEDRFRLKARKSEAMVIEGLMGTDYRYLVWDGKGLVNLNVDAAKKRYYYGEMEAVDLGRSTSLEISTPWGSITGLRKKRVVQSELQ